MGGGNDVREVKNNRIKRNAAPLKLLVYHPSTKAAASAFYSVLVVKKLTKLAWLQFCKRSK